MDMAICEVLFRLGLVQQALKKDKDAVKSYEESLRIIKNQPSVNLQREMLAARKLLDLYKRLKRFEEREKLLKMYEDDL